VSHHEPNLTVSRFLRDGRIANYPAKQGKRHELLVWVAGELSAEMGESELPEKALNELLSRFTDDVSTLRRYLVDSQLLTRQAGGTAYSVNAG
jgi:hypothetical protein